jgi:simple sugar transport system permease protein
MGWMLGNGLRETIQLSNFKANHIISDLLAFKVAGITFPVGMMLVFALFCFLTWLFFKSKTGMAIFAGGQNPRFAEASGLAIDRNRIIANIISTILGGLGIIIYSQGYGYAQLYNGPLNMAFPAVAAVLVGGATASKASIPNVIIGTCLFQGLMTTAMPVMNQVFTGTDLSDIMRIIIQNGVILYALTKVKSGGDR